MSLTKLAEAQRRVWATLSFLRQRKANYRSVFTSPAGEEVLLDLVKFTKFLEGPVGRSNEETWRLIGRQDVLRRIQQHCNLTVEQLFALYSAQPVPTYAQLAKANEGDDE